MYVAQTTLKVSQTVPSRNPFDVIGGRFKPIAELGSGGTCRVDLAEDRLRGGKVAIKRLNDRLMGKTNTPLLLAVEAAALASICHPGVPRFVAYSEEKPDPYVAMKFVEGVGFGIKYLRDPSDVLQSCISVCDILSTLHQQGIVHRDMKPANILLKLTTREPVLLDFGFAIVPGMPDFAKFTEVPLGTPMYMAPEQTFARTTVDYRADIYALGVITYSLVSRNYPYLLPHSTPHEMMEAHRQQEAPPMHLKADWVPQKLSRVVAKAMNKDPAKRFASAEDFSDSLSDCLAQFSSL
jgi:serine/threonine-protein kinase